MSYTIHHGDCREVMATLEANSIDSIVTDPPYGLSFMGKGWDHGVPGVEFWTEALRVAKPGAHLLAFGGSRTYHRLACAIEDAGWEVRDCIMWIYGQGFSKGFNLKRLEICECGGNAVPCTHEKMQTKHDLRPLSKADLSQQECSTKEHDESLLTHLQQQVTGAPSIVHEGSDKKEGRENEGREQPCMGRRDLHRTRKGLQNDSYAASPEGEAQRLCVGTHIGSRENAWETSEPGRGSASHQQGQVGQQAREPEDLQQPSGTLDGGTLPRRGACERCGKLKKEYQGFSSNLKPAHEPIIVARKPLVGTIAENVLAYGTGGLNVDGCRVGFSSQADEHESKQKNRHADFGTDPGRNNVYGDYSMVPTANYNATGRWPANVIHDGSDEVLAGFPENRQSGGGRKGEIGKRNYLKTSKSVALSGNRGGMGVGDQLFWDEERQDHYTLSITRGDTGSAARFFYTAKASKADRDGSTHPTMKPTDLMRYLCRLVTPPSGLVLDPFCGSGSTGKGAILEGFNFTGIEREAEYVAIAKARCDWASKQYQPTLFDV